MDRCLQARNVTKYLCCFLMLTLATRVVLAQRDPPLLECYLPSITVCHAEGERISIDLILKKETGPTEHREHQMILLAYLKHDEPEILNLSTTPEFLDKNQRDSKLFLDVLLEKGLVTTVGTKVAKRSGFAGQDNVGKYADGSKVGRSKDDFLKLNSFSFAFSPSYADLFNKVSKLKNYRKEDQSGFNGDKFKLLVYVPVNDCKYAAEVRDGIRGKNDFGLDEYGLGSSPILYLRPLPYEFMFRRDSDVGTIVYIR